MQQAKENKKTIYICRTVAGIILAVMVAVFCYAILKPIESFKLQYNECNKFSTQWRFTPSGDYIECESIEIEPGETITLYHNISNYTKKGESIGVYDPGITMRVYVNGKLVSKYGEEADDNIGNELGSVWVVREISPSLTKDLNQKNILTLWLKNNTSRTVVFELSKTYMGQMNDINNKILLYNMPSLLIVVVAIFMTVTLFGIGFSLQKYKITLFAKAIFNFAMMIFFAGAWFLTDSNILQFISSSVSFRYVASYFIFLAFPIFFLIYLMNFVRHKYSIIRRLLCGYIALIGFVMFAYQMRFIHISKSIIFIHIAMAIIYVTAFIIQIKEMIRDKCIYCAMCAFAYLCVIIGGAATLMKFYIRIDSSKMMGFRLGFVLMLSILSVVNIRLAFKEIRGEVEVRKLKQKAYVDSVTGGNSVNYLSQKYEEVKKYGNYWLVYMNLVSFKLVNEIIGWDRGSELLRLLYKEIESCLKKDEYMCALGQSSFLMLVQGDAKAQEVKNLCEDVKKKISKLLAENFPSVAVKAEFSACSTNHVVNSFESLVDLARIAYKNKYASYNIKSDLYLYTDSCKEHLVHAKQLEGQLRQALENHELELFLQPKVDPENGKINGAEALVRWRQSNGSILNPIYFIPVFEKNGTINQVDLFMFREMCLFLNKWIEDGNEPFKISVNVSKSDIINEDYFMKYKDIINELRPPMQWIEFELTESIAYEHEEDIARIIDAVHYMGATCAMDDFGSSYSNLAAIQKLQFDTVKIDRSIFTHGFPNNEKDYQMVSALMRMFTTIGIFVVAEGIDKKDQVETLRKLGCHSIQGYYYSRPLSVDDFKEYFNKRNNRREG